MKIYRYVTGPLSVNTYLVVDEETNKGFIVDPGGEDIDLLEFVKENNIEIEYIILTHGHGDHICGLESYQKAWPKASLIVHEEEHELLSDPRKNYSTMTCGRPLSFTADHYVQDGEILKAGGLEIKFVFTPGHTPGGMCVYVGDSLFSGDTLFARSIGRTDFPGSSFAALKKSIEEKLYTLPADTMVYPGHMEPTTIGIEKEQNPFV
ncbi:MAG: MBL fold metallo-hydrolase [Clostridiales Family XIII bacterium]|jgi:hydroxyacylglutathione hydrolase|nr:MBL fold metallo-hydrolase [Clostridiales Family XIII bacterium]